MHSTTFSISFPPSPFLSLVFKAFKRIRNWFISKLFMLLFAALKSRAVHLLLRLNYCWSNNVPCRNVDSVCDVRFLLNRVHLAPLSGERAKISSNNNHFSCSSRSAYSLPRYCICLNFLFNICCCLFTFVQNVFLIFVSIFIRK